MDSNRNESVVEKALFEPGKIESEERTLHIEEFFDDAGSRDA